MREKEKLTAEIEARLHRIDQVIEAMNKRAAAEKHMYPGTDDRIKELIHKRNEILQHRNDLHEKLEMLQQEDENTWEHLRQKMHSYMKDIDEKYRDAMSYWK